MTIHHRLRNRLIECLGIAASRTAQQEYQTAVPMVSVPAELLCWWEECWHPEEAVRLPQVYRPEELTRLQALDATIA